MAKVKASLPLQMAIGMIAGIVVGILAQNTPIVTDITKFLGDIFIRLIRMVVVPLVFATLVAGAAGISDTAKLGRVAVKTMLYYLLTTMASVAIGLLLANIMHPGAGLNLSTEGLQAKQVTPPALSDTMMNLIPINPVEAMAKGNMLQIIIFAIIFGFGISALGESGRHLHRFFDACGEAMVKVTGFVMMYAPIGVFGLMAYTVTKHGLSVLLPLGKVIVIMYLGCAILFCCMFLPLVKFIVRIPVKRFVKGMLEPFMIGFTTCSSAAALPSNMRCAEELGASRTVASFGIPLGNTINMNGTALYMGINTIFVAEVFGIPMPFDTQLTVILMSILAAVGTMGVPGAALIMLTNKYFRLACPLKG